MRFICVGKASFLVNFKNAINLNTDAEWQGRGTNRKARVLPFVTEDIFHEVRCSVNDLGVINKIWRAGNETAKFDH